MRCSLVMPKTYEKGAKWYRSVFDFHVVHLTIIIYSTMNIECNQIDSTVIIHSFDECKLDYRTECNRIRLTLFLLLSNCNQRPYYWALVARKKKKNERRFQREEKKMNVVFREEKSEKKKKSLLNSSSEQRLWKGLNSVDWLVEMWVDNREDTKQCNDKVEPSVSYFIACYLENVKSNRVKRLIFQHDVHFSPSFFVSLLFFVINATEYKF